MLSSKSAKTLASCRSKSCRRSSKTRKSKRSLTCSSMTHPPSWTAHRTNLAKLFLVKTAIYLLINSKRARETRIAFARRWPDAWTAQTVALCHLGRRPKRNEVYSWTRMPNLMNTTSIARSPWSKSVANHLKMFRRAPPSSETSSQRRWHKNLVTRTLKNPAQITWETKMLSGYRNTPNCPKLRKDR